MTLKSSSQEHKFESFTVKFEKVQDKPVTIFGVPLMVWVGGQGKRTEWITADTFRRLDALHEQLLERMQQVPASEEFVIDFATGQILP